MKQTQRAALARQKAHGDSLREWLHDRRLAAAKRLAEERKNAPKVSRGVDRVPARYRDTPREVEYVVEHTAANYATRRAWALGQGRKLSASGNTPHVNPLRDEKRRARLKDGPR